MIFVLIVISFVIGCNVNHAILKRKEKFTYLVSFYARSTGWVFNIYYIIYIYIYYISWYGMVWYGMIWYDMIWYDMILWYDIELIFFNIIRITVVYIKKKNFGKFSEFDHDLCTHDYYLWSAEFCCLVINLDFSANKLTKIVNLYFLYITFFYTIWMKIRRIFRRILRHMWLW